MNVYTYYSRFLAIKEEKTTAINKLKMKSDMYKGIQKPLFITKE